MKRMVFLSWPYHFDITSPILFHLNGYRTIANAGYVLGKKALGKLKVPENYFEIKAEGYDGHLEWEGNTERDVQMEYLCKLLQAPKSAEMTKEALMIAICIGSRPLVELILSLFRDFPHEERSGCSNSPGFLPHMTPLMLASILNNFSIVQCLLLRGHSIDLPHHVDALRAVCSEAFLWLATDDPFAAACSLSQDLAICMKNDNFEFMDTYRVLYNNIQRFTCRIIENNWRVEELDIFLAHVGYTSVLGISGGSLCLVQKCHCSLSSCAAPYPRIQLALEARMRHFAGSPNVQRAMSCIWWRGWGNFGTNPARDSYRVLRHVFLYPILALLYIFSNGKLASSFDVPLARRQFRAADFLAFGIAIEAYCYLYILGLMLERYIQFSRFGFRNYFAFWWRWFDFLLIGSFCLAFHLWICGVLMPMEPDLELLSRIHWLSPEDVTFAVLQSHPLQPAWDYFLIYDIYLCTGCILGFWRVFYFFQLIKGIGGSVISVGSCISTIYNYLVVMGVVMLSFAVGVNLLVQPYLNSVVVKEDGTQEAMNTRFGTIFSTIRNMYWAVYGYLDPSVYPTVNGNSGPDQAPVDHYLTSFATELLLTIYHCIIVIILLNLMVSLLVKKADEVLENEESEFKYTRIVIYSEYFAWSSSVPPPFNLLYVIKEALWKLFGDDKVTISWPEIWTEKELIKPDHETCSKDCMTYNNLMMTLFSRFRASKECHYRSIFRTEFDKDRATAESAAKVAFMNSFNDRYEAFQWKPPQPTAVTPPPRAAQ
uniref:Ion_trans domain-containing protein n=1 Tax=Haemonchus placei TaxID=6290 RepID=A0A0N4WTQ0_HAEPC